MRNQELKALKKELRNQIIIIGIFVTIFWIVEICDHTFFNGHLDLFGIIPRNFIGLRGIIFAPFLHGNFPHLIANTPPFIALAWFVMLQNTSDFFIVTAITMLIGGLGVWLIAPTGSVTVGASILIFGYLGFMLSRGYFQKNKPSISLSLLVFFLYGSLIWGVLPSMPQVSWQGHLFGFIGGVIAAKIISGK